MASRRRGRTGRVGRPRSQWDGLFSRHDWTITLIRILFRLLPAIAITATCTAFLPASPSHAGAAQQAHSAATRQPLLQLPKVLPNLTLRVPILMYHHISSLPPATALNYGLTVTDQNFTQQLAYLQAHGYDPILLSDLFAAMYQHKKLPAKPIVLTFDDGYNDNYTDALPILQRFHFHGEFNIISAYVGITLGVNSYMTWPQLHALVAAGMEIGSHTVDHQDLGLMTEVQIRHELRDSRYTLQTMLGINVQFLAYPSGEPFASGTVAAQQLVVSLMPQYGYVGALLDGPVSTSVQSARTPFQWSRIRVSGGEGLSAFAASLQQ